MTARELRAALGEGSALRMTQEALRSELAAVTSALYHRIGHPLSWLLQEGARAHEPVDVSRAGGGEAPRGHQNERECQRWQRATLLKVIALARPPGIDLEDLELKVARWGEHPGTLGHAEALAELAAARASMAARNIRGLRARCPLCDDAPQQESAGYAWPEGLSRHLEGRGNVGECPVIEIAFTACSKPSRYVPRTDRRPTGPAACHPELPAYEYGDVECARCHEAAWKAWRDGIDTEVTEWASGVCRLSAHWWDPDDCTRCGAARCRARYHGGERCPHPRPCAEHPLPAPVPIGTRRGDAND